MKAPDDTAPAHGVLSVGDSCSHACTIPLFSMEQRSSPDNNGNWQSPWDQAKGSNGPDLNPGVPDFLLKHLQRQDSESVLNAYALEQIKALTASLRRYFGTFIGEESEQLTDEQVQRETEQHLEHFRISYQMKLGELGSDRYDELAFIRSLPCDGICDLTGDIQSGLVGKLLELNHQGTLAPNQSHRAALLEDLQFITRLPESIASKQFMADKLIASYLTGTYAPNPLLREQAQASLTGISNNVASGWDQLVATDALLQIYFSSIGAPHYQTAA